MRGRHDGLGAFQWLTSYVATGVAPGHLNTGDLYEATLSRRAGRGYIRAITTTRLKCVTSKRCQPNNQNSSFAPNGTRIRAGRID